MEQTAYFWRLKLLLKVKKMMNSTYFIRKTLQVLCLCCIILMATPAKAQEIEENLVGNFAIVLNAGIPFSSNSLEKGKVSEGATFAYFPNPKSALSISYRAARFQQTTSVGENSTSNVAISMGGARYFPIGKRIAPFVGFEAGLNFMKVTSPLLAFPENSEFMNDLASYLFLPKIGCLIKVNKVLQVNIEGNYFLLYTPNQEANLTLIDKTGLVIIPSKKIMTASIGLAYSF